MLVHEKLFEKVKEILAKHFPSIFEEETEENLISLVGHDFWLMSNEEELTIGFDFIHRHYDSRFSDFSDAIDFLTILLTCDKIITLFKKGEYTFKYQVDAIHSDSDLENIGYVSNLIFPFWKTTTTEETHTKKPIDITLILEDIKDLRNLLN